MLHDTRLLLSGKLYIVITLYTEAYTILLETWGLHADGDTPKSYLCNAVLSGLYALLFMEKRSSVFGRRKSCLFFEQLTKVRKITDANSL